jgi:hypothetical protein
MTASYGGSPSQTQRAVRGGSPVKSAWLALDHAIIEPNRQMGAWEVVGGCESVPACKNSNQQLAKAIVETQLSPTQVSPIHYALIAGKHCITACSINLVIIWLSGGPSS